METPKYMSHRLLSMVSLSNIRQMYLATGKTFNKYRVKDVQKLPTILQSLLDTDWFFTSWASLTEIPLIG